MVTRRKHLDVLGCWVCLSIAAQAQGNVTFEKHIEPIFTQACTNCHNPDKKKGDLDLSTYNGTLAGGAGGKIVAAGDSGSSSLFGSVSHTFGAEMPPEGDKLNAKQINLIRAWIDGGLLENDSSKARVSKKPKIAIVAPSVGKPKGPPPMPRDYLLEPVVVTERSSAVLDIECSPWAPLLAVTGQQHVLLYHTQSLQLIGVIPLEEGQQPTALAFHQSGKYLAVGHGVAGKSGMVSIFEIESGKKLTTTGKLYDTPMSVSVSTDMKSVLTGGASRMVKTWSVAEGVAEHNIKKHTDWLLESKYSPDGVLMATADRNGGVYVWEAQSGEEFYNLRGHQKGISSMAWSADSNYLATSSEDGSVRVWGMHEGNLAKNWQAHGGGVLTMDWGRNGLVVTAGRDKRVKLWNANFSLKKDLGALPVLPSSAAVSHDGKLVFVSDALGKIHAWEAASGRKLMTWGTNTKDTATRLANAKEQVREIQTKLKNSAKGIVAAEKALAAAQARLAALENQLKAAARRLKALEVEYAKVKQAHGGAQAKVNEINAKLKPLRAKEAELREMHQDMHKNHEAVAKTLEQDQAVEQKLAQAHRAAVAVIEQVRKAGDPEQFKVAEKNAADAQNALAAAQKQTMQSAVAQRDAHHTMMESVQHLNRVRKSIQDTAKPIQGLVKEVQEHARRRDVLVKQVQQVKGAVRRLTKQREHQRKVLAGAQQRLAGAKSSQSLATARLRGLKEQIQSLEIAPLNTKRIHAEAAFSAVAEDEQDKVNELTAVLLELRELRKVKGDAYHEALMQVRQLKEELDNMQPELAEVRAASVDARDAYFEAKKNKSRLAQVQKQK